MNLSPDRVGVGPGGSILGVVAEIGTGCVGGDFGGHDLDVIGAEAGRADGGAAAGAEGLVVPRCEGADLVEQALNEGVGLVGDLRLGEHDGAGPLAGGVADRLVVFVVDDGRFGGGVEQGERLAQDVALEVGLVGEAERSPEREGDGDGAGDGHADGVLANQADAGGGDALALDEVGERSNGARAERSNGCEEGGVDTGFAEQATDLFTDLFKAGRLGLCAHE